MTLPTDLTAAYKWHKQRLAAHWRPTRDGLKSVSTRMSEAALTLARVDVAAGTKRYPTGSTRLGAEFSHGLRWCESPESIGLRFVGYADELANIRHKGWYTDDDMSGETMRGVVYQLPARNGRVRYVSGYEDPCNGSADNNGPAAVDFGTIWEGEPGEDYADSDHYGAHRDAANHADSLAEDMAESERDYNRAWQAGSQWAMRGDDITDTRRELLALLAERRQAKADAAKYPTLCATLANEASRLIDRIHELRRERRELAAGNDDYLGFYAASETMRDAFNEGAGENVIS